MPSKSRVVKDQRKTEEIIQAYGHETTPENLALFNGVIPTRILNTPSHDTGAEATFLRIEPQSESMDLQVSPVDGLAPADLNKSRDSKPGGLNTIPTKHEDSITKLGEGVGVSASAQTEDGEEALIDSGTYITPEVIPSVTAAGVPLMSAEEKASAQEAAQARKAEVAEKERRAAEEKKRQQEQQAASQHKSHK